MGILQALCGGQPLLIVGAAEPIVIIYAFMFEYATREGIPFLAWSAWTCVWASAKRDFLPDLSARLQQGRGRARARTAAAGRRGRAEPRAGGAGSCPGRPRSTMEERVRAATAPAPARRPRARARSALCRRTLSQHAARPSVPVRREAGPPRGVPAARGPGGRLLCLSDRVSEEPGADRRRPVTQPAERRLREIDSAASNNPCRPSLGTRPAPRGVPAARGPGGRPGTRRAEWPGRREGPDRIRGRGGGGAGPGEGRVCERGRRSDAHAHPPAPQYEKTEKIGEGTYGVVFKGKDKRNGERRACGPAASISPRRCPRPGRPDPARAAPRPAAPSADGPPARPSPSVPRAGPQARRWR